MSIESVIPSNHFVLCCPLLLLPSIFPSIKVFSNESVLCIRCPKYWSFSFNISPSNECSGLISFRIDWLNLLAVQGTLKSLLQHDTSKASILWHSNNFGVYTSSNASTKLCFSHDIDFRHIFDPCQKRACEICHTVLIYCAIINSIFIGRFLPNSMDRCQRYIIF